MSNYKVLYRKYRPENFNELIGQDNVKEILINSIIQNKIAHAYVFTGPRGTGKTSTAKIFAKTLNCINNCNGISCDSCNNCVNSNVSADIIEIDAASNNGVDEIRSLRESVSVAPFNSKYKVYIIDEVHMLSTSAWNAFLKTLEEPPGHVIFILATTDINKVPQTVLSRCQRYDFSLINITTMLNYLKSICEKEAINITDDALLEICKLSEGCLRDSLSFLDQISKLSSDIDLNLIEETFGVLTNKKIEMLLKYIETFNKQGINDIVDDINNSGITPSNFINCFNEYLLNKIVDEKVDRNYTKEIIKKIIFDLNNLALTFNNYVNPFLLIKLQFVSSNYFPGNNLENISREIFPEKVTQAEKMQSVFTNTLQKDKSLNIDNIKKIRINNSFVNPSKTKKTEFTKSWLDFVNNLMLNNNYNILGFIDNINIEVVSDKNVLFSFNDNSSSIIFNTNSLLIEKTFNDKNNCDYKFVSLDIKEWKNIKDDFIKNKSKKYEYIEENEKILDNINSVASDIFGDDIIEME